MLIRNAELIDPGSPAPWGGLRCDLRCAGEAIVEIGEGLPRHPGEAVIDASGGALMPGLHDHHLHLFALAAAHESVPCGPPTVESPEALGRALRERAAALARAGETQAWLRGVGYHECVAGDLDARQLDRYCDSCPVRIQHRSGVLWTVNSLGAERLALERFADLPGVECDERGRPTGRLFRLDGWLAARLGDSIPEAVGDVSRLLATFGVTGFTDASYTNSAISVTRFRELHRSRTLLQRVRLMGDEGVGDAGAWEREGTSPTLLEPGELKIILDEAALPPLASLEQRIAASHSRGRAVALHCVTATELLFALEALKGAGALPGDRIEHAAEVSDPALGLLRASGVTVVTQPHFIRERGDQYCADVAASRLDHLYRCGMLQEQGIPVGGGSDAPFGDPNPWTAMAAAVDRRTEAGVSIGPRERITPERALRLFATSPGDPGGSARSLAPGAAADLCLLEQSWQALREGLARARVRATVRGGELIHCAG